MSSLLPFAAVAHLAFAVWMLSNTSLFQSSSFSLSELDSATSVTGVISSNNVAGQRIRQKHIVPLFLLLVIVVGVRSRSSNSDYHCPESLRLTLCLQLIVGMRVVRGLKSILHKFLSCLVCGYFLSDDDFDRRFRLEQPVPLLSK